MVDLFAEGVFIKGVFFWCVLAGVCTYPIFTYIYRCISDTNSTCDKLLKRENIVSAVMPFEVNSTWRSFPVYDYCWKGVYSTEVSLTISSIATNEVYKVHEVQ